jgi:hypothetical protein
MLFGVARFSAGQDVRLEGRPEAWPEARRYGFLGREEKWKINSKSNKLSSMQSRRRL